MMHNAVSLASGSGSQDSFNVSLMLLEIKVSRHPLNEGLSRRVTTKRVSESIEMSLPVKLK